MNVELPKPRITPDPCRLCGGEAEVAARSLGRAVTHYVRCTKCGAEQDEAIYGRAKIAEWNANSIKLNDNN